MYTDLALAELITRRARRRDGAIPDPEEYDSRFAHWEERASVRRKPYRVLDPSGDELYFPPELVPVVHHPLVVDRGPDVARSLLVHRLYDYLHFTTALEQLAVIPVAANICRGRLGLDLAESMRADAFKIVTDEAWHAQFSYDLLRQVETVTNVACGLPGVPAFAARLDAIRDHLPDDFRGAEALFFAVVSETLISSILADLPSDRRLPVTVRGLVRDHAEDEGRHHAYFRSVLVYVWSALSPEAQQAIGPLVPEMIFAFLEPDYRAIATGLGRVGFTAAQARQILAESLPRERVVRDTAAAAVATVRYFTEVGALDDGRTRAAFQNAGLLLGEDRAASDADRPR
jgi:P-aminobenzoate N-oxygenase AurF